MIKSKRKELLEKAQKMSEELYYLTYEAPKVVKQLKETEFTEEQYGVLGLIDELEHYEY